MTRPSATPASIVLTAGGDDRITEACLATLRPTMRPRDELILVASAGTPAARASWIRRVDSPGGADLAARREAGRAAAGREIVVYLDDDVLLPPRWLEPLVAALADPSVVAVGPSSNLVSGAQGVLPSYEGDRRADITTYARAVARERAGRLVDLTDLSELCFAVRTESGIAAASRLPEGRAVLAADSYLHHSGTPTCPLRSLYPDDPSAPLLSASLIVKDEEAVLAECLASLAGLCDEIVVYDTGSTDRTREIARDAGATVIEGYWNDSFADARNRCLAHCSGRWALVVDADERAVGEAAAVRGTLRRADRPAYVITIESSSGGGIGSHRENTMARLFKPAVARYTGRLHEQLVHRTLGTPLEIGTFPALRLLHLGYLDAVVDERHKGERNLQLAERAVAECRGQRLPGLALALTNLAHCQVSISRYDEALATLEEMASVETPPPVGRLAAVAGVLAGVGLESALLGQAWVDRLGRLGERPDVLATFQAAVLGIEGRYDEALACLAGAPEQDGRVRATAIPRLRLHSRLLAQLGRYDEAVDVVLDGLRRGISDVEFPEVLALLESAGRPLDDLVAALPPDVRQTYLGQALQLPTDTAESFLDAMYRRLGGDLPVLAAAASLAPRLTVLRALEWAARMRQAGLQETSPLMAVAGDSARSARDRLLSAAVEAEAFSSPNAWDLLPSLANAVPDEEAEAVLEELRLLAPTVGDMFVRS